MPPSLRARVAGAALAGLAAGALTVALASLAPRHVSDFDAVWAGARFLVSGGNPYLDVGPHGRFWFAWHQGYPLPALLTALPLAWVPVVWARAVFSAIGAGALAYGLTGRRAWWPLLTFASAPYFVALFGGQWAPLLTAGLLIPPLAALFACKPTVGAALAAAVDRASWRPVWQWAIAGGGVLVAASFLARPTWLAEWIANIRGMGHFTPLALYPGGLIVPALALLRWRRPEARLVAALACVPQTGLLYDALPLLALVPRTAREARWLALGSWVAWLVSLVWGRRSDAAGGFAASAHNEGVVALWLLYLPCALLVLRQPNEATHTGAPTRPAHPLPTKGATAGAGLP